MLAEKGLSMSGKKVTGSSRNFRMRFHVEIPPGFVKAAVTAVLVVVVVVIPARVGQSRTEAPAAPSGRIDNPAVVPPPPVTGVPAPPPATEVSPTTTGTTDKPRALPSPSRASSPAPTSSSEPSESAPSPSPELPSNPPTTSPSEPPPSSTEPPVQPEAPVLDAVGAALAPLFSSSATDATTAVWVPPSK